MPAQPLALILSLASLSILASISIGSLGAQAPPTDVYPGDPVSEADKVFVSLDTSADATCGITAANNIRCWGNNLFAPMWAGGYVDVAVGTAHTCGLTLEGTVECWGLNNFEANMLTPPTDNGNPIRFKSIDSNQHYTCGIRDDNDGLLCWGYDSQGQVSGAGGSVAYDYTNDAFTKISTSTLHTCGIIKIQSGAVGSNVRCWGGGGAGEGIKSALPNIYSSNVFKDIDAGADFTCGIIDGTDDDGKVICWGTAAYGIVQTPIGSIGRDLQISEPSNELFTKISSGHYHVCGIKTDDTIACWGATKESGSTRAYGQADVPTEHQSSTFSDIVAAQYHTCAILDGQNGQIEGDIVCWGAEIPYNPLRPNVVPDGRIFDPDHPYPPPHRFPQISSGYYYNCGLSAARDLVCWGGSTLSPGIVDGPFKTLDMGERHVCAIKNDGHILCWGINNRLQASGWTPNFDQILEGSLNPTALYNRTARVKNLTTDYTFKSVSASRYHTCGILDGRNTGQTDGTVICWGEIIQGQTSPPTGMTFSSISAGWFHTCGILDDQNQQPAGQVVCWGFAGRDIPEELQDVPFNSISSSRYHTCGVRTDNEELACWGTASTAVIPADIAELQFIAVAASWYATCGITSDGLAKCWGPSRFDQNVQQFRVPTDYVETKFVAISVGLDHACATKENGKVICWGADADLSTPQLEIYRPHSTVDGAFTIINTRQAWVPREFRASPINPPPPTPTPGPKPTASVRILRIEPDIRGIHFRPDEPGRLGIEVYGRQGVRDDAIGDHPTITFEWIAEDFQGQARAQSGSFVESVHSSHDRVRNQIPDDRRVLYNAPIAPGRYRVRASLDIGTECLPAREHETNQDAIDRCTAIFEITVRRVTPEGPTPEPPIDPVDLPDVIVDPDGTNYEVFTPSQGGEFVEGPCSFKAPRGAVHNNEVIGVRVTVLEDEAHKLPAEDPRFITDGVQCQIQAVDLQGSRIVNYQLRQAGELCMPLPDRFRRRAIDTLIGVIDNDVANLTRLTSKIYLASHQGNLSELSATTTVALPEEAERELPPTPTPPEISDIDTGGSELLTTSAIIALTIGMAIIAILSGATALRHRRRGGHCMNCNGNDAARSPIV